MPSRKLTLTVLSLLLAILNWSCGEEGHSEGTNGVAEKVTDVKAITVAPRTFTDYIEVTGTVIADITSVVSAEESGVIENFLKEKGDRVKQDEVIVKLNSRVLKASYDEARAAHLLSEATYKRQANLYKDNVISEQKYLETKYANDRNLAYYENLKARLEKSEIESPIPGYIDEQYAEVGEFVQPGVRLFRVVKTDVVKVSAGVPERFMPHVNIGSLATITFDVFPGETFEGKVTFLGPSINKNSRTFPIEIDLGNREGKLKPEMFANVRIRRSQLENVVVIPRDAIIESENGKFAFVANGGVAHKRAVKIGASYENEVWIEDGVKPGDQLIVIGHRDLVDGERIALGGEPDSATIEN
jgi:RND family efflux transporter MFP subunit